MQKLLLRLARVPLVLPVLMLTVGNGPDIPWRTFVMLIIGVTLTVWFTQLVLHPRILIVAAGLAVLFRNLETRELVFSLNALSLLQLLSVAAIAIAAPFAFRLILERRSGTASPREDSPP